MASGERATGSGAGLASVTWPLRYVIVGGMELLTEDEIASRLGGVPGWTRDGSSIIATVARSDFRDALLFVGAVGYLAEQADHHPDVLIQWNKVTLTLSTHSAGGLTGRDFDLAAKISALS
jgi:4a-hydroxytetrahydrobiopterin dehydratase